MAFNLKLVLKALLFSSSQPLTVKDIQAVFGRFHEQAARSASSSTQETAEETESSPPDAQAEHVDAGSPGEVADAGAQPGDAGGGETNPFGTSEEGTVVAAPEPTDADLYQDVPALITSAQIREAMDELAVELRELNDIYFLIDGAQGYRIVTHPRFARWIRILRDEPPPVKLSQSALETLAVVAYRQPVTRSEIESIRGVSADAGLNKLLERELVYIVGRADLPGRPLQYGTTDKFLEFVGVKSLVELPASDVLSPRQIDEWLNRSANTKPPSDAEMGLPLENKDDDDAPRLNLEQPEEPGQPSSEPDTGADAAAESEANAGIEVPVEDKIATSEVPQSDPQILHHEDTERQSEAPEESPSEPLEDDKPSSV